MLHCFQCGADLPDNVVYCLQCGTRLEDEAEVETVVVDPPIVVPIDPRPEPVDPSPFPVDPRPIPSEQKQTGGVLKFILGGVIGAGVVVILLAVIGIVIYSVQGDQSTGNARPNAVPANTPTATPTPSPTATKKPTPTPANTNVETAADVRTCEIVNPAGGSVNLRRYCDTRDCSLDASTLYTQASPGDVVELTGHKPITTGRFTWLQVKYGGQILWVSSNRINCQ